MSDLLPAVGFFSYTSKDDESLGLQISELRTAIEAELKRMVTDRHVNLWQDSLGIEPGDGWRSRIEGAIQSASFIIPIITPRFFQSAECCREVLLFSDRERELRRADLIFPIDFVDTSGVHQHNIEHCSDPYVYGLLKNRQWFRISEIDKDVSAIKLSPNLTRRFAEFIAARLNSSSMTETVRSKNYKESGSVREARRARSQHTLAERFETFAENNEIINIGAVSVTLGLALIFTARLINITDVVDPRNQKQVGFLYAPNWSIMYTVLFPAYNVLFCTIVERVRKTLRSFYDRGIIVAPGGSPLEPEILEQSWRSHLRLVSFSMWTIISIVIFVSVGQWVTECYKPLSGESAETQSIDWGTIGLLQAKLISPGMEMIFTAVAYTYMAFALCIYLFVLLYIPTFMLYLRRLSAGSRDFQIMIRGVTLQHELSTLLRLMFFCTFLGLLSAYLMRLQSAYRLSNLTSVFKYMVSGGWSIAGLFTDDASVSGQVVRINITSSWSSLLVALAALGTFAGAYVFSRDVFINSREYLLAHSVSPDWRARVGLADGSRQIEEVAEMTFNTNVVPQIWIYLAIMTCLCLALLWPNYLFFLVSGIAVYLVRLSHVVLARRGRKKLRVEG